MKLLVTIIVSLLSIPAMAGEFFLLDMEDVHMRSDRGQDTIGIRRQLKNQHPGLAGHLKDADLMSVMMVAKTRVGKGVARLVVGGVQGKQQVVGGKPGTFAVSDDASFDRVLFENKRLGQGGRWQVLIDGNFKVRQLMVEIDFNRTSHVILDYDHFHMRTKKGTGDTIFLRDKAQKQLGFDSSKYELEGVTLLAKSKKGKGKVHLLVGKTASAQQAIGGHPTSFDYDDDWSYSTMTFDNPKNNSNGVWQMKFQGNIKVKEAVLHLRRK